MEIDQENNTTVRKSSQQRKLCYRHLLNKVETINETDDVSFQTVKDIGDILKDVNGLEEECPIDDRVEHADETLLDAMVLSSASSILIKCIEAVDVFTITYEASDFTKKIINTIRDKENDEFETEDLLRLLDDARMLIPEVPDYSFVYGSYDLNKIAEPKEVKQRQTQTKERFEVKQPEQVTNLENEEIGINEIVKTLHDLLLNAYVQNSEEPIKYYDYVIDTDDFGSTVENMFYCAFLVRDGRAHFDIDGRGTPFIKPMKKRDLKQFRDNRGSNAQMITTITIEDWEKFKKPGIIQRQKAR